MVKTREKKSRTFSKYIRDPIIKGNEIEKQPSRGVVRKWCSKNMKQI